MSKKRRRLIVCLTGMPGAGKSSVASFLKEKGFAVVTMGDAVREEAKGRASSLPTST
jgi:dephospho-CoA kinase